MVFRNVTSIYLQVVIPATQATPEASPRQEEGTQEIVDLKKAAFL
jgi:hypothetical protein